MNRELPGTESMDRRIGAVDPFKLWIQEGSYQETRQRFRERSSNRLKWLSIIPLSSFSSSTEEPPSPHRIKNLHVFCAKPASPSSSSSTRSTPENRQPTLRSSFALDSRMFYPFRLSTAGESQNCSISLQSSCQSTSKYRKTRRKCELRSSVVRMSVNPPYSIGWLAKLVRWFLRSPARRAMPWTVFWSMRARRSGLWIRQVLERKGKPN